MSDGKSIKIRAQLDTSSFDQDIQKMTARLQQLQKTNNQITNMASSGSTLSPAASYAQGKYNQSSESILRKQSQEIESEQRKEAIALVRKQAQLDKIKTSEGGITAEKQKQIDLLNREVNLMSRKVIGMESTRQDINSRIGDIQSGGYRPAKMGTPDEQSKGVTAFTGILKSIGVGAIINGALNIASGRIENERNVLASQGITARISGRGIQEQFSGQGSKGLFFAEERQRAMGLAAKEQKNEARLDWAKIGASMLTGAVAGSVLPGAGTLAGAAAGAATGAGVGFGAAMVSSPKLLNRVFDKDSYRQMMTKEGMEKYEQNLAMEELKNPQKSMAYSSMQGSMDRNKGLERSLGITGRGLYGESGKEGWMANAMNPYGTKIGFTQDEVSASSQSLIGAGATSQGARAMAGSALQFQRNLRLGNSQEVMGQLSGTGMESSQTDQAVIKLMSEAMKLGINSSTMPQEMKRMVSITAELASSGGGFSETALSNFGAGVTSLTQSGMQGARDTYGEMIDRSKSASGLEGQMGMGFLQGAGGKKAFGKGFDKIKSDSKLMNALNQYSAEDLEKDPELARGLADKMGITTGELISGMRQKDEFKQTRTSSQAEATAALGEGIRGMTPNKIAEFLKTAEGASLFTDASIEDINSFGTAESSKGADSRRSATVGRARRMSGEGVDANFSSRLAGQLGSDDGANITPTERIAGSAAIGDAAKLSAVNKHLDGLVAAASKHTQAAEMYNVQFDFFVKAAKSSGDALQQMNGQLEQVVKMMEQNGIPASQPKD